MENNNLDNTNELILIMTLILRESNQLKQSPFLLTSYTRVGNEEEFYTRPNSPILGVALLHTTY